MKPTTFGGGMNATFEDTFERVYSDFPYCFEAGTQNIAGVIGSMVAILFVTVFKVDIYTFAIMMLIINVIQNGYDYYKWIKYLR